MNYMIPLNDMNGNRSGVVIGEATVLRPQGEMMLCGVLRPEKGGRKGEWPRDYEEKEICVARVVSKVFVVDDKRKVVAEVQCRVLNVRNCPVTLCQGYELGVASAVDSETPLFRGMGKTKGKRSEANSGNKIEEI